MAGYWFTSSTSFANPAVTVARALTDSFAGIRPADVAGFIAAQTVGAVIAVGFFAWLWRSADTSSKPVEQAAE
jgi:glycerol uptake facilitator-like aquaporin